MPYTISHAAVVLPFSRLLARWQLLSGHEHLRTALDRGRGIVMALREDLSLSKLLLICIPVLAGSIGMIIARIGAGDARDGFLLDGFPRNGEQADALEQALHGLDRRLTAALLIKVPDDELVRRVAGRRVCVKNPSHIYHVDFDPPKHDEVCDQDGARLIQRDDDREEVIRRRLEVYHSHTEPLVAYYDRAELLRRFDGRRSADEVHAHIRATVATLRLEEGL